MLTNEEHTQLLGLLAKLEPGFYPIELFWQFARLTTTSILEFVPVRVNGDSVEVLLIPRAEDDVFWAGEVHIPGCVVRPNDTRETVFERIQKRELKLTPIGEPEFLLAEIRKSKRGSEQAQVFWVEVVGEPTIGEFFEVNSLPENLVENQQLLVQAAANAFLDSQNS